MKDEEMAEEYADGYATPDLEASFRAHIFEASKEGFLAGLKAGSQLDEVWYDYDAGEDCYEDSHEGRWVKRETGRPQWHDLKKKNAELTDENKNLADSIVLSLDVQTKNYKKLEQAKALIKEMLPYMPKENIEGVYEIVTHAEEFIKG